MTNVFFNVHMDAAPQSPFVELSDEHSNEHTDSQHGPIDLCHLCQIQHHNICLIFPLYWKMATSHKKVYHF